MEVCTNKVYGKNTIPINDLNTYLLNFLKQDTTLLKVRKDGDLCIYSIYSSDITKNESETHSIRKLN